MGAYKAAVAGLIFRQGQRISTSASKVTTAVRLQSSPERAGDHGFAGVYSNI